MDFDEEKTKINSDNNFNEDYIPKAYILDLKSEKKALINRKKFIIGKAPSCSFTVEDPMISRIHCNIVDTGNNFILEDLQSTNGTFINKVRVNKRILKDNDIFILGGHKFQFFIIK
ncbi:FHA domain-containing protein [bacterium]|nr:FHA domain-containing protein [bacterium]